VILSFGKIKNVRNLKQNRYVPSLVLALKIAREFKVPVEEVFDFSILSV